MKSTHDILIASGYELLPNGRYKKADIPQEQREKIAALAEERNKNNKSLPHNDWDISTPLYSKTTEKEVKTSVKKIQRKADIVSRILRCHKP